MCVLKLFRVSAKYYLKFESYQWLDNDFSNATFNKYMLISEILYLTQLIYEYISKFKFKKCPTPIWLEVRSKFNVDLSERKCTM